MSLYPPPKILESQLFTSLPNEFRFPNLDSDWIKANKPGQKIHSFLEGPSFDREGNLFVTDIPFGRIFKISPERNWTLVSQYEGWPNGLRFHKDGRIFIADYRFPRACPGFLPLQLHAELV